MPSFWHRVARRFLLPSPRQRDLLRATAIIVIQVQKALSRSRFSWRENDIHLALPGWWEAGWAVIGLRELTDGADGRKG